MYLYFYFYYSCEVARAEGSSELSDHAFSVACPCLRCRSVLPSSINPSVVCPCLRRLSVPSSYVRRPLNYLHFSLPLGFFGLIWNLMKLERGELLIVPYMCCCFSARSVPERIHVLTKSQIYPISCFLSLTIFHFA